CSSHFCRSVLAKTNRPFLVPARSKVFMHQSVLPRFVSQRQSKRKENEPETGADGRKLFGPSTRALRLSYLTVPPIGKVQRDVPPHPNPLPKERVNHRPLPCVAR